MPHIPADPEPCLPQRVLLSLHKEAPRLSTWNFKKAGFLDRPPARVAAEDPVADPSQQRSAPILWIFIHCILCFLQLGLVWTKKKRGLCNNGVKQTALGLVFLDTLKFRLSTV